jgi:hypothetical protein
MEGKVKPETVTKEIWQQRYPTAKALLLCGSVIRGEGTRFSDLDIVVVFDRLDHAWRESYRFMDWPVEAFVHDLNTLKYFFYEVDAKSGCPSLPRMVAEGIAIPETTDLSDSLKQLAHRVLDAGPPALSSDERDRRRYAITDLVDDIREPRCAAELMAVGAKLFEHLADYYLRSKGEWSATGKTIIRRLHTVDPEFGQKYEHAFRQLFVEGNPGPCIELSKETLENSGGLLFDGYRQDAPASWRLD